MVGISASGEVLNPYSATLFFPKQVRVILFVLFLDVGFLDGADLWQDSADPYSLGWKATGMGTACPEDERLLF